MNRILFAAMLLLVNYLPSFAQKRPLSIGDTIPEIVFKSAINHKTSDIKLSQYRGKMIILDFWATWCGPCIRGLPRLDSLQEKLKKQVQFIAVSDEKKDVVQTYFRKRQFRNLVSATDESDIRKLFPFRVIPHSVWISSQGVVMAITSSEYITEANITGMLSGKKMNLSFKNDIVDFDSEKPFFISESAMNNSGILYYSMATRSVNGLASQTGPIKRDGVIIGFHDINGNIPQMLLSAYRKPSWYWYSRLVLENISDSTRYIRNAKGDGTYMLEWNSTNGYCYELVAPRLSFEERNAITLKDLNNAFKSLYGLTNEITTRKVRCFLLSVRDSSLFRQMQMPGKPHDVRYALHESWSNRSLFKEFSADQLAEAFETLVNIPFKNATGYAGMLNFEMADSITEQIQKEGNLAGFKKLLQDAGLEIKESVEEMEVLVLRKE